LKPLSAALKLRTARR
jgi:transcription elongation GreA/GreB family factor